MSAYLIVNYDVENPELYGEYQAGAAPALRIGSECEIVVFDPETVTDNSTYAEGLVPSTGFKAVVVNGTVAVRDDELLGVFPGQPIRFEPEAVPRCEPVPEEAWNREFSIGMPDIAPGLPPEGST